MTELKSPSGFLITASGSIVSVWLSYEQALVEDDEEIVEPL